MDEIKESVAENVVQAVHDYMKANNINASEMARRCRMTAGGMHRILNKQRKPSLETLISIAIVTKRDISTFISN